MKNFRDIALGALNDDDGDETDWGEVLWMPLVSDPEPPEPPDPKPIA